MGLGCSGHQTGRAGARRPSSSAAGTALRSITEKRENTLKRLEHDLKHPQTPSTLLKTPLRQHQHILSKAMQHPERFPAGTALRGITEKPVALLGPAVLRDIEDLRLSMPGR